MLPMVLAATLATVVSTAAQRDELALTVYNQNFGLVREVRELDLDRGPNQVEFADVAATIQPETVWIKPLTRPDSLRVLEQSYRYDLLSPQKLLEKYVGRMVRVYRWNETLGRDEEHEARVLAANGGTVLQIGDEITFNYPGRIAFPEIPENLIARPTLRWLLHSDAPRQKVEVSYLARQLSWKADYVMVIDGADERAALTGWVTLDNQSGATYENASLKLVAGDVQRVGPEEIDYRMAGNRARALESSLGGFAQEGLFEYHLYTLQRTTTLLDREQKQVTLLEAPDVAVRKRMVFRGQPHWYRQPIPRPLRNQKVGVFLELENSDKQGLGMPLPKGVVRVYKADSQGAQQFIGEDRIDHTPRGEKFRIKTGEAFDVVADRKQTAFEITGQCRSESAWEIEIRNHKDRQERVEILERASGDWRILSATHPHVKEDATSFRFDVGVPARGSVTVGYRVRVRWC